MIWITNKSTSRILISERQHKDSFQRQVDQFSKSEHSLLSKEVESEVESEVA